MLSFECDYNEGAHEQILRRLIETNNEQLPGYGNDKYCDLAKAKIKAACGRDDAEVFLLVGGTQTNQIVIDTVLAPYEGVVSANTGHINVHEAGAIEYSGHKVLTVPHEQGKIKADVLEKYLEIFHSDETKSHMVYPGMVYISHPTEYGTLYSLDELTALSGVCKKYDIPLYLDGARLGYGLMSSGTDVTLKDVARLCDVFYIGGTKVGALCGEAVVFTHNNAPKGFFTSIKQHGALLAKGRVLGIQFDALFTDDLYFKISRHAIEMADIMRKMFIKKGYKFFIETVTNQIFIILENKKMEELKKSVSFSFWEILDEDHTVVRFASSWATRKEDIERLSELL
ncbi:MAG: aminotransferase class I/II-fold pyridoxal phosphate-dependent enzyme [Clostridia bacterium]|nr:aminotransferase class I/II-fold pyridoxal phosphate-dependent enzyme [Clostridia bacterium]